MPTSIILGLTDRSTGCLRSEQNPFFALQITNEDGTVIGALQMINKEGGGAFDENDEKIVHMIGSHVSTFIRVVESR